MLGPLNFGPFGFQELLLILVIVVLLFGATRLPQIGRGLGEGIRNFKRGFKELDAPAESDAADKKEV